MPKTWAAAALVILLAAALVARPRAAETMPPGFVDAGRVVPGLRTDIRYAGAHNFTGAPVAG